MTRRCSPSYAGYRFPAEGHRQPDREHVCHRAPNKTKGCHSRDTALAMVFMLAKSAEHHWRRVDGSDRLAQIIKDARFRDGAPVQDAEENAA